MMFFTKKNIIGLIVIVLVVIICGLFFFNLGAVNEKSVDQVIFQISQGEGFRSIAQNLAGEHLIRSPLAFEAFLLIDGKASSLRPGLYRLGPSMDTQQIISIISGNNAGKVTVTIPEGSNIYDIDRILSNALVIKSGDLINFGSQSSLEGHLFPDTYEFYTNSNIKDVVGELVSTFNVKANPLMASLSPIDEQKTLIIASILEKEVPNQVDQKLVAGIILKRISLGMPLGLDATICYAKFRVDPSSATKGCVLTALDFKIDSPYNTYLYKGLPVGPIGNPGISAITAALHPESSSYLYYLSDPKTGKTIFAKTLDEQNQNKVKYLEGN